MNSPGMEMAPEEVTSICDAAAKAWAKAPAKATSAPFTWRGRRYVASHTSFRLLVNELDGTPVAARYE